VLAHRGVVWCGWCDGWLCFKVEVELGVVVAGELLGLAVKVVAGRELLEPGGAAAAAARRNTHKEVNSNVHIVYDMVIITLSK
jgi:hypothetical protein